MRVFAIALATGVAGALAQPASWQSAPTTAVMLPSSVDCWEPALAVGPREEIYIVAGRRTGAPGSKEFDQQQVLWRSVDEGATFEGPWVIDANGHRQGDERIAVDQDGTIYVSYMDHTDLNPGAPTRLQLARPAHRDRLRGGSRSDDRHDRKRRQDMERGARDHTARRTPLLA